MEYPPLDSLPRVPRPRALYLAVVLIAAAVVCARNAWVGDDAYISFRAVDNLIHGYGLRWNVAERVQAFTNPLWTLLVALAYALTREIYFTSLALSIALTLFTVWHVAGRHARGSEATLFAGAALILSKSFVDYGVSGLENPLAYALTTLFLATYLDGPAGNERRTRALYALAALAAVNRLDAIVLLLPALADTLARSPGTAARRARELAIGMSPLLAWEVFALAYYGFPFPNTYYAKVHTGIPTGEYVRQGLLYFVNLASLDPVALAGLFAGVGVAIARPEREIRVTALGIALHLVYVVAVGGDFMTGRFVSTAYLAAVILISRAIPEGRAHASWAPAVAALALGVSGPRCPIATNAEYSHVDHGIAGIADEKGFYFPQYALVRRLRTTGPTRAPAESPSVYVEGMIGRNGFFAGPRAHLVDPLGLSDPLLARLPSLYDPAWRVGHYLREIPKGYLETLKTGSDALEDPALRDLWSDVRLVTRGELWSAARWGAIWRLNTGWGAAKLDSSRYRFPAETIGAERLGTRVPNNTAWDAPSNVVLTPRGLFVALGAVHFASRVEASFDHNDRYALVFFNGSRELGSVIVEPSWSYGIVARTVATPERAHREGFDRVFVKPFEGDGFYSMGHLIPLAD